MKRECLMSIGVQVENRVDTSVEVALPLQIVALALPYVQIFGSLVFALASHYPSVIAGYFILAYNGGMSFSAFMQVFQDAMLRSIT